MDAALQTQLTIAALTCSVVALFFSLLAAFPGLKHVLTAVRDGVLWVALFLILGAAAFVVWQQMETRRPQSTIAATSALPSAGGSSASSAAKVPNGQAHAP